MNRTIGTCSICKGPVVLPSNWHCIAPPVPRCLQCGALARNPYGFEIPMRPHQGSTVSNLGLSSGRVDPNNTVPA